MENPSEMLKSSASKEANSDAEKNSAEPNLRYKLSEPDFIFQGKCSPETCIDPNVTSHSIASILNETMSEIKLNSGEDGHRGAAHAFEASGTSISPELKRQEFMAYLRKSGFIADIAKVLLTLYDMDDLPEDKQALEFISKTLGYGLMSKLEQPAALAYRERLEKQIKKYERERDILRRVLDNFESSPAEMDFVDPKTLPPLELLESDGEEGPYVECQPMKMQDLQKPLSPSDYDPDARLSIDDFVEPPRNF